jgi:hypothetical protein
MLIAAISVHNVDTEAPQPWGTVAEEDDLPAGDAVSRGRAGSEERGPESRKSQNSP